MMDEGTSTAPEYAPSATESPAQPAEDGAKPPVAEPEPAPEPEPAKSKMTMGQQQAVRKGERSLDMGGFSRQGLIDQLVFEGFSKAEAESGGKAVGYWMSD